MLAELQTAEKVVGIIVSVGSASYALWRQVVRPKVWEPGRRLIARLDHTAEIVKRELETNGGSSLKDEVRTVAAQMAAFTHMFERAVFQTDASGFYVRVNRAYQELVGYPLDDLRGMGWVNALHPEDRDRVVREWEHAVEDLRICTTDTRLVTRDRVVLHVRLQAEPMRARADGPVLGWFGTVMLIEGGS